MRWLLGEWTFGTGWTLTGSAGISRHAPEPRDIPAERGSPGLRAERARQFDLGLERRLTRTVRWQATLYVRHEGDVLRPLGIHPAHAGTAFLFPKISDTSTRCRERRTGSSCTSNVDPRQVWPDGQHIPMDGRSRPIPNAARLTRATSISRTPSMCSVCSVRPLGASVGRDLRRRQQLSHTR